jgi:hypothetical protein
VGVNFTTTSLLRRLCLYSIAADKYFDQRIGTQGRPTSSDNSWGTIKRLSIGRYHHHCAEDDNKVLDQIISQNSCPDSKFRKRFVYECFLKNGEAMYGSMHTERMPGLVAAARS